MILVLNHRTVRETRLLDNKHQKGKLFSLHWGGLVTIGEIEEHIMVLDLTQSLGKFSSLHTS